MNTRPRNILLRISAVLHASQIDSFARVIFVRQHNGHKEDILSVASCPPNLLATSSYDGEASSTERANNRTEKKRPDEWSEKEP